MYAHTTDFSDFNNYITCKNTFGQAVGIDYTYVIDKSLLVSAGAEIGYERYKFIANKPFAQSDIADGMQPDISTAIYSAALNVNIGYRFMKFERIRPEIRIGIELLTAFNSRNLYSVGRTTGKINENQYLRRGSLGRTRSFSAEPVNFLYIGFAIPSKLNWLQHCSVGLELQKKVIDRDNPFNNFTTFFESDQEWIGKATFEGSHTAMGIQIAYTL